MSIQLGLRSKLNSTLETRKIYFWLPAERSQGRSQHASRQRFNLQRYRFCTREHQVYLYSPEGQEGGCFGVGGKEGLAGLAVRVIFQKVAK